MKRATTGMLVGIVFLGLTSKAWAADAPIPEMPSFLAPFVLLSLVSFAYWVRSIFKK